jgi:osmotically-inducible protein OsmY
MSDHTLEDAVMTALADNAYVPVDEIAVEVIDGRPVLRGTVSTIDNDVTLTGWVTSSGHRAAAVEAAAGAPGVVRVHDALELRRREL